MEEVIYKFTQDELADHDTEVTDAAYDEVYEMILNECNQVVNFADKLMVAILKKKKALRGE